MPANIRVMAAAAALLTIAQFGIAHAATIYDNGASAPFNSAPISDVDAPFFVADNFTLSVGQNIVTGVRWTGAYGPGNSPGIDNFTLQFFNDTGGGTPQTAPFLTLPIGASASRTDTGTNVGILDVFQYSIDIAPIVLPPGTQFWLSIFNDTTADVDDQWGWTGNFNAASFAQRPSPTVTWLVGPGGIVDFQLTGNAIAASEPGGFLLLTLGLAALGVALRSNKE